MTPLLENTINTTVKPLNDMTNFDKRGFNGWRVPPNSFSSTIIDLGEAQGHVLFGGGDKQYGGVVLTKTFIGLVPGAPYRVRYLARKSANIPGLQQNVANLRVMAGTTVVVTEEPLVRLHFIEFEGQFTAAAKIVQIDFVSVAEGLNLGFGNYYLDDICVYGRFDDLTDFKKGDWGLWQPTPATQTAVFEKDRHTGATVLHFETFGDDTDINAGDVLTRSFTDLTPGTLYTFSVEAINNIGHPVLPILSLTLNGQELEQRFTPTTEVWATYPRDFVATADTRLSIRSHVGTGRGNDYSLNNLRVVEKW